MSHDYERVIISGRLICRTPLSIGAGAGAGVMPVPESADIEEPANHADIEEPANRLAVCKGLGGVPYLPGSSLRGLLRALLLEDGATGLHRRVFGAARGSDRDSQAGLLRVYDAFLAGAKIEPDERPRNAIEPVTGTTRDHALYSLEQIPAGAEFDCRFELERCDRATVAAVLGLLKRLDGKLPESRLGRGAGKSEGRVEWQQASDQSIKVLTPAELAKWLRDDGTELDSAFEAVTIAAATPALKPRRNELRIPLRIRPLSPLLVDPVEPTPEQGRAMGGENGHLARVEKRAGESVLVVPAASLRGVLRSHCRKILMTLLVANASEMSPYPQCQSRADALIGRLFGHEGRASAVILEDATAPYAHGGAHEHEQHFNAVDRFTGGVADGALFWAKAAVSTTKAPLDLITTLRIDLDRLAWNAPGESPPDHPDWWRGLLLLVLRDAMDGDLILGRGKARGYGVVRICPKVGGQVQKSWEDLLKLAGTAEAPSLDTAETWLAALHDALGTPEFAAPADPQPAPR